MFYSEFLLVRLPKVFLIGILISKASGAADLPCDFEDSVDITKGIPFPNQSILLNGMEFLPEHYAEVNYKIEKGKPVPNNNVNIYGCPCKTRPCLRLCCPYGFFPKYDYSTGEPKPIGCTENDRAKNFKIKLQFNNGTITEDLDASQHFGFVNEICEDYIFATDHLTHENGSISDLSTNETQIMVNNRSYCILVYEGENVTSYEVKVCSGKPDDVLLKSRIISYLMLISVVFIIVTVIIYLVIPELRNYKNTTFFVCYLVCLAMSYILLSWIHLNGWSWVEPLNRKIIASLTYFSMLSVATWSNVISFDVWLCFRTITIRKQSVKTTKQVVLLMTYAWGIPLLILTFGHIMDSFDTISENWKPGIGIENCFLVEKYPSKFVYYYLLFCIMFTANIIFFVLTAWKIMRVKREVNWCKEENKMDFDKSKENAVLALRLFLMMGVGWILEGIPSNPDNPDNILTYGADIFNCLQPVLIFFLFLLNARARKFIKKRWNSWIEKPENSTEMGQSPSAESRFPNTVDALK